MAFTGELAKFLKGEFDKQTATLRQELEKVKEEIKQLRLSTASRLDACEERTSKLECEVLKIKRNTLKNNIIVTGLKLDNSNILHSVISQLNSLLDVNLRELDINNIYRLGKNKPEVKIEFLSYLVKSKVITNRHKLKGYKIYISEDLCEEDRRDFKLLRQHLNLAKQKNYRAYIRHNYLFVNGERYSIQQLKEQPILDKISSANTTNNSEELVSHFGDTTDVVTSAPNSPAPIARIRQMVTEHEHLLLVEDSKIVKELSAIDQVLNKAKDVGELGRTRSQASSSGSNKKSTIPESKLKKGG